MIAHLALRADSLKIDIRAKSSPKIFRLMLAPLQNFFKPAYSSNLSKQ